MSAPTFEEQRQQLELLLAELDHCLWERGIPRPTDAAQSSDGDACVSELVERLARESNTLPARKRVGLLAGIVLRVTEARLRTFTALAARLSEPERVGVAALLRLPADERQAIATLLRLADRERHELAVVLGLTGVECEALAAFVDERGEPVGQLPQAPGAGVEPACPAHADGVRTSL